MKLRMVSAVWLIFCFATVMFGQGSVQFAPPVNYPIQAYPSAIILRDFNLDGKPDLAIGNSAQSSVSVLLSNGNGTFQNAIHNVTGPGPFCIAAGDFNADGKPDIVSTNLSTASMSVLIGNGNGTFQPPVTYGTGTDPMSVAVGDFNGDGKQDVVVSNYSAASVSVLLGNGNGTFQNATFFSVAQGPYSVATADFNGDGKADIVTASLDSDNVTVLLGNGNGTFQSPLFYASGSGSVYVLVGDYNNDGRLDLAIANYGNNTVSVLIGNGNGSFQSPIFYSVGTAPFGVAAGDFNGDGIIDLASANYYTDNVSILLGNGNGTFQSAINVGAGASPFSLIAGDFNVDGKIDLAVSNDVGYDVSILLNTGGGSGGTKSLTISKTGTGGGTVTSNPAGINCGSTCSAAFSTGQSVSLSASAAVGSTFVGWSGDTGCSAGNVTMSVARSCIARFDLINAPPPLTITTLSFPDGTAGTSYSQNAGASGGTAPYSWLRTSGLLPTGLNLTSAGALTGTPSTPGTFPFTLQVTDAASASVSQGLTIVIAPSSSGITTTSTLTNVVPGASTFGNRVTLTAQVLPAGAPGSVMFMDGTTVLGIGPLNSSGIAQLSTIALAAGNRSLRVVYGGSSGVYLPSQSAVQSYIVTALPGTGFSSGVNNGVGIFPTTITVGEFNGDGRADLAVANFGANSVSVLFGNANGTFQSAVTYAVGNSPYGVTVGDFNGDGRADLATANQNGSVSVLLGNGNGTFQSALNYGAGNGATSVATGDFNGDGKADLVTANFYDNTASVLLGNGDGTFQPAANFNVSSGPFSIAVGDFNGDGRADLAAANFSGNNVSVLLGNGNGTFQGAVNYGVGSGPTSILIGDFNGDSRADLAVSNYGNNNVSVLLGNGNGTFQSAANFAVGNGPFGVAAGDFNGDGRTDIVAANKDSSNVSVLMGNGNGTFQSAANFATASGPYGVTVGDFNGDGRADLATAAGNVTVLLATAGATNVLTNVALQSNGGTAVASSFYSNAFSPSTANDGDRKGFAYWNDSTLGSFPDVLEIDFNGTKTIGEVDVFSVQDSFQTPVEATLSSTFSLYGIRDFEVQYWTGSSWTPISGGTVSGNNKVWRQFVFAAVPTTKIRVVVTGTADGVWSRITEVEAYADVSGTSDFSLGANPSTLTLAQGASGNSTVTVTALNGFNSSVGLTVTGCPSATTCSISSPVTPNPTATPLLSIATTSGTTTGTYSLTVSGTSAALLHTATVSLIVTPAGTLTNVALPSNGGSAIASSSYSGAFSAANAIDGDRKGIVYWNDGTANAFPDILEIDFNGNKSISEIDVFTVQDNFQSPSDPTPNATFTLYGLRNFEVQYWTGSAFVPISGGTVTNNNLVWRQFVFSPIVTSKIRVVVNSAADGVWSRITEVEAYSNSN